MKKQITNIIKGLLAKKNRKEGQVKKISWIRIKILKHQNDRKIKICKLEDFKIYYIRPYELLHTYQDVFEKRIYWFTPESQNPLIIDCGSNIGLSILFFKKNYPNSKIIAFEPDTKNFDVLKQNIQVNKLQNIELKNSAIWIKNGFISFKNCGSETSHIVEEQNSNDFVKSTRLADCLLQYDVIDFLKIDIEGAELAVLKDCSNQLSKIKNLFIEYHGKVDETNKLNEILMIITAAGFSIYIKTAADNLHNPYITKKTGLLYDVQLNLFAYKL